MRQFQRRNQMNKSNKNLTEIGKRVLKYTDTYDDNVIVDGNEIKLESQLRKEIEDREKKRKIPSWMVMKQVAQDKARKGNTKELNDLLNIERKMRKKSHTAQRREPNKAVPDTGVPLKLDVSLNLNREIKKDNTLEVLEKQSRAVDPDLFRGIGIFLNKKI